MRRIILCSASLLGVASSENLRGEAGCKVLRCGSLMRT